MKRADRHRVGPISRRISLGAARTIFMQNFAPVDLECRLQFADRLGEVLLDFGLVFVGGGHGNALKSCHGCLELSVGDGLRLVVSRLARPGNAHPRIGMRLRVQGEVDGVRDMMNRRGPMAGVIVVGHVERGPDRFELRDQGLVDRFLRPLLRRGGTRINQKETHCTDEQAHETMPHECAPQQERLELA